MRLCLNGCIDKRFGRRDARWIKHGHALNGKLTPEYNMWLNAKGRARRAGVDFNIDIGDIKIPDKCPILDIPLVAHNGARNIQFDSPSLDRIRPDEGYVVGNVWVISFRANRIKCDARLDELIAVANALENKIGGSSNG